MFQFLYTRNAFPFFRQADAMDCGPTCLQMIAAWHGKTYPLQYLRNQCKISRQGVTFADIIAAGEQLGFNTLSAELPFTVLAEKAPLPCILHWDRQHFVVLYKVTRDKAYIADPALGRSVRYSIPELLQAWQLDEKQGSGRALFLEPTPQFFEAPEVEMPATTLRTFLPYVRQHRRKLIPVAVTVFIAAVCSFLTPLLTEAIVDKGISSKQMPLLLLIGLGQLTLFSGKLIADFLRARILLTLGAQISIMMLEAFLLKLMRLPFAFFDNRQAGDNMQRVTDNQRVEDFLTTSAVTFVMSVIMLLVLGGTLLYYNWWIFLLFAAGAGAGIAWTGAFGEKRGRLDQKRFRVLAANQDTLLEIFSAFQEVKLTGGEQLKINQWTTLQQQSFAVKLESLKLDQFIQGVALFINETRNVVITCLTAILVVKGQLTLGEMVAITFICGQLNAPVAQLADFIRALQNTKFSLQRIAEVHHEKEEDPVTEQDAPAPAITGDLRLSDVSFQYGNKYTPLVLNHLHLTIPAGKMTAIVGLSGSGKTTLLKLLLKFYGPSQGHISVGNHSFQDITAHHWRQQCGAVMQDGYVFRDTIANNIFGGATVRDRERMIAACQMANIHGFFAAMPFGYDTMIGKDGYGLSEGQTQRLLIARLIYRNPAYIFLDEATNSLDASNERDIINNLHDFFTGKTVVVVAHRLSTVRHADQILVMDKGAIVEAGTHETLITAEGAYYRLIKNQLELGR
ncbi:peptidase domain-containing ABC transporter [Chitinophaga rhizophila]|uniref:Peptidase domain-containing ABC transporter n=1 Tax=Chitinophaga rhizophila TaxID=2866212 RepID=A0ABS7G8W6_9BACT|nr:peptidase domain-containing ABC transporter [Chitinophaga rhizophila]MBW8682963.1 peptidase domain-containing ABC transporter [Chitinophaga rhizophila]